MFSRRWWKRHPEPEDLLRLLDGELTPPRHARIGRHAARCRACQEELSRLSTSLGMLERLGEPDGDSSPAEQRDELDKLLARARSAETARFASADAIDSELAVYLGSGFRDRTAGAAHGSLAEADCVLRFLLGVDATFAIARRLGGS